MKQFSLYSLRYAFLLLLLSIFTGISGYVLIEGYSFNDALFMSVITISTVGYGTVSELSENGKLFTSLYIIMNIAIFAYVVAVISRYFADGKLRAMYKQYVLRSTLKKMKNHVIVCGLGRNGMRASKELLENGVEYVVVDKQPESMDEQGKKKHTNYISGDATSDEVLKLAGIADAKAIITTLPHDSDNVFVTLTAKEYNPKISVIARASESSSESKLYRAGATNVVLPDILGGHYMASLVTKPTVIEFLELINGVGQERKLSLEEFGYKEFKDEFRHVLIRDLDIRQRTGATILGLKDADRGFLFNPDSSESIKEGMDVIVLGSIANLKSFKDTFTDRL